MLRILSSSASLSSKILATTTSNQLNCSMAKSLLKRQNCATVNHCLFSSMKTLGNNHSSSIHTDKTIQNSPLYDVVVIGGGHAGCQAAYAAARTSAKVLLITQKISTIGQMSCNPSMGGIGKGHLIRQIDALGGLVGRLADLSAFQFKVLNSSRGEAVQGPRQQVDRDVYKGHMQKVLKCTPNLEIKEMSVEDFLMAQEAQQSSSSKQRINAILGKNGERVYGKNFVLTTGTFLRGMIHIGLEKYPAGRHIRNSSNVQPPSIGLADTLKKLNFPISRATTGTPPRIDGNTIDFSKTQVKKSDQIIQPFSFIHEWQNFQPVNPLLDCYMTSTNAHTHKLIQKYRHLLPIFDANQGKGQGPRYCPAIEKKVIRFPDKASHQIWLEPEGLNDHVIYPNGLNNGFPADIQVELLRTVKGLQNVVMTRPGYAVQYDYIDPKHLDNKLNSSLIQNLFLAGQVNGTTGYEQAAAQGIIAGLNAAFKSLNRSGFILDRSQAYIGVLIDDLTSLGITQPYRMFTSRSEYRMILRPQNADMRLTPLAMKMNILSPQQQLIFDKKLALKQDALQVLSSIRYPMHFWQKILPDAGLTKKPMLKTASQLIGQNKSVKIQHLPAALQKYAQLQKQKSQLLQTQSSKIKQIDLRVVKCIQTELKYQGITMRMLKEIKQMRNNYQLKDITNIPYEQHQKQFTSEEYEKLTKEKPKTIFAASRLSGIRPTTLLYLHYLQLRYCGEESANKQRASTNKQNVQEQSVL